MSLIRAEGPGEVVLSAARDADERRLQVLVGHRVPHDPTGRVRDIAGQSGLPVREVS